MRIFTVCVRVETLAGTTRAMPVQRFDSYAEAEKFLAKRAGNFEEDMRRPAGERTVGEVFNSVGVLGIRYDIRVNERLMN